MIWIREIARLVMVLLFMALIGYAMLFAQFLMENFHIGLLK